MTNQTVTTPVAKHLATAIRVPQSNSSSNPDPQSRLLESMRTQYRLDQQVKFLHLQAEAETLLQLLQTLKQQRQGSGDYTDRSNCAH